MQNRASLLLWKLQFTKKKLAISHNHAEKKGRSRVTKIPCVSMFQKVKELEDKNEELKEKLQLLEEPPVSITAF